jgi:hypothetical protein
MEIGLTPLNKTKMRFFQSLKRPIHSVCRFHSCPYDALAKVQKCAFYISNRSFAAPATSGSIPQTDGIGKN